MTLWYGKRQKDDFFRHNTSNDIQIICEPSSVDKCLDEADKYIKTHRIRSRYRVITFLNEYCLELDYGAHTNFFYITSNKKLYTGD